MGRLGIGGVRCEVSRPVVALGRVACLYGVGKRFSGRSAAHLEGMAFASPDDGEGKLVLVILGNL